MKIPFDIKYQPQIESGEYKVETENGHNVRIICWDRHSGHTMDILALVENGKTEDVVEDLRYYDRFGGCGAENDCWKLVIITPDPELTEFEEAVGLEIFDEPFEERHIKVIKEESAKLLALARDQFIKDGYVIEKKAFHDAVENISDKNLAEMSVEYSLHCKIEDGTRHAIMNWEAFQKVAQKFIDVGKAEALKDLPRWKIAKEYIKLGLDDFCFTLDDNGKTSPYWATEVEKGQYYITESDIENLPKED